jgi:hypothetical protein
MLEVTLGIIACCLPTLRPLLQHKSIDSVLRSVRSKTSLDSRKAVSNNDLPLGYLRKGGSKTSHDIPLMPGNPYQSAEILVGGEEPRLQVDSQLTAIRVDTGYMIKSEIIAKDGY